MNHIMVKLLIICEYDMLVVVVVVVSKANNYRVLIIANLIRIVHYENLLLSKSLFDLTSP